MIAIIDYEAGNSPSVLHAAKRLGLNASLVNTAEELTKATHIILPGVGNAGETMRSLNDIGLTDTLNHAVLDKKIPYLGICIGMQIIFEYSFESDINCLGWLKGQVMGFDRQKLRVPQIGWNKVEFIKNTPVTTADGYFYFVNSYYAKPEDTGVIWGTSDYGGSFTACVNSGNIYGTQFHVEKSGEAGLAILKNFCLSQGGCAC